MIATDKCYDTIKNATGDSVQKRTTYTEIATPAQMPTETCNVHGEPRTPVVADAPAPEVPRAQAAADLTEVKPVILKGATLLAENDPYNSVKSIAKIDNSADEQVAEQTPQEINNRAPDAARAEPRNQKIDKARSADDGKPILKAIPVEPRSEETPVEIRRAIPVGPMDEVEEGTLLKAASPSPAKSDDE
jgi:hypothetical protein